MEDRMAKLDPSPQYGWIVGRCYGCHGRDDGPARRSLQDDPKGGFTEFGNPILSLEAEEAEDKMIVLYDPRDKTRIKSNETRGRHASHVSGSSRSHLHSV
jgi:hypothetical protein